MMDRREALLLVERLKRRTRDPDVLTLCEYVHETDVHGQSRDFGGRVTGHRRLCFRLPYARCARHVGRQRRRGKKMAPWAPRLMLMAAQGGRLSRHGQ